MAKATDPYADLTALILEQLARELALDDELTCREKEELLAASRQLRDRAIGLGEITKS